MDDASDIPVADNPVQAVRPKGHLSLQTGCIVIYLLISLPALLALCFVTAPFQVPDEASHFLRATQLSHGRVLPVISPDGRSAGGYVEQSASLLTRSQAVEEVASQGPAHFTVAEVLKDADQRDLGPMVFAIFRNTVIYFPVAHAVPAIAVATARAAHVPPLGWLYAGRLVNALTAIAISATAIFLFEETSLFALVVCTLPMVLFEEASLSSDALGRIDIQDSQTL